MNYFHRRVVNLPELIPAKGGRQELVAPLDVDLEAPDV
jgi:hypothetical protein